MSVGELQFGRVQSGTGNYDRGPRALPKPSPFRDPSLIHLHGAGRFDGGSTSGGIQGRQHAQAKGHDGD